MTEICKTQCSEKSPEGESFCRAVDCCTLCHRSLDLQITEFKWAGWKIVSRWSASYRIVGWAGEMDPKP